MPLPPVHISVVIPTLNEAATIGRCLDQFAAWTPAPELIVVDGGSTDATRSILASHPAAPYVLVSPRGRGKQLRTGAAEAQGSVLLFLHADTQLPATAQRDIYRLLAQHDIGGGYFRLTMDGLQGLENAMIALKSWWRSLIRAPLGDQGVFCWRTIYDLAGGVPEVPILEDYLFATRLRQATHLRELDTPILASGRRFQGRFWQETRKEIALFLRYFTGTPLETLREAYRDDRPGVYLEVEPEETFLAPQVAPAPSSDLSSEMPEAFELLPSVAPPFAPWEPNSYAMLPPMLIVEPLEDPIAPEPELPKSAIPTRAESPPPPDLESGEETLPGQPRTGFFASLGTALSGVLFPDTPAASVDALSELPPIPEHHLPQPDETLDSTASGAIRSMVPQGPEIADFLRAETRPNPQTYFVDPANPVASDPMLQLTPAEHDAVRSAYRDLDRPKLVPVDPEPPTPRPEGRVIPLEILPEVLPPTRRVQDRE